MEPRKKSPRAKKKMTREEMQLAIIKKKECDAKALAIVEQLLEPEVNPAWLVENLKNISKCHMEDVIEERAITRVCGYVLCKKPLTVVYKQQYHISLKDKKVYDITKRKNFCSSACFGASNYLLEQMLTSPLWARDKEEIPKFRIFSGSKKESNDTNSIKHGEVVDITATKELTKNGDESQDNTGNIDNPIEGCIEEFVLETVKDFELKNTEPEKSSSVGEKSNPNKEFVENIKSTNKEVENEDTDFKQDNIQKELDKNEKSPNDNDYNTVNKNEEIIDDDSDDDIIEQTVYPIKEVESEAEDDVSNKQHPKTKVENGAESDGIIEQNVYPKQESDNDSDDDIIQQCVYTESNTENKDKFFESKVEEKITDSVQKEEELSQQKIKNIMDEDSQVEDKFLKRKNEDDDDQNYRNEEKLFEEITENERNEVPQEQEEKIGNERTSKMCNDNNTPTAKGNKNKMTEKIKILRQKKRTERKEHVDGNLAARVENSFQEWLTNETINYLFGDVSVKQEAINKIERQDKYDILCQKLNRLQFEEDEEDAEILQKPILKPAPHFAVLKEEGEKLDVKVKAFYGGKTTYEEPKKSTSNEEVEDLETFLPLTESHAPQILRRKIFLEKLDQILPDLLRTLAGNNEVYARASLNYTSLRCTAVKALVQTFSLSAKNIIFKTAEWTLVGLVMIKMLSLSDAFLASLLSTKQANLYISMILTAYKLNSDYLNLLVASFNPNMNPR